MCLPKMRVNKGSAGMDTTSQAAAPRSASGKAGANPLRFAARVPASQIGYVNAIVESYEGVCMMRTRDAGLGLVEFWAARGFVDVFHRMIEGLRTEMPIELLADDPEDWSGFKEQGFVKR